MNYQVLASSAGVIRRVRAGKTLIALISLLAVLLTPSLARPEALTGQYQIGQIAVSRPEIGTVSVPKNVKESAKFLSRNVLDIPLNSAPEVRSDVRGQTVVAQYQASESQPEDRRLMFRIALGLALAYVVFLAGWFWATRLRSRPPHH
jgi:hypothetical protein